MHIIGPSFCHLPAVSKFFGVARSALFETFNFDLVLALIWILNALFGRLSVCCNLQSVSPLLLGLCRCTHSLLGLPNSWSVDNLIVQRLFFLYALFVLDLNLSFVWLFLRFFGLILTQFLTKICKFDFQTCWHHFLKVLIWFWIAKHSFFNRFCLLLIKKILF